MSQSQSIQSHLLSDEEDLFRKLAPCHEDKPKVSSVNILLKKKLDKQLQKKIQQTQKHQRERSRSRDRKRKTQRLNEFEDNNHAVIVISDDDQSDSGENTNKFRSLQKSIYRPIECFNQEEGLSYRERLKIDRIMERGMRQYKEGKLRDQLSFSVFNTIQAYFK